MTKEKVLQKKGKVKIQIWIWKCPVCKIEFGGADKNKVEEKKKKHLDGKCNIIEILKRWDDKGITKDMVKFYEWQELEKKLRKLIMKYSLEKVQETVEMIENER